MRSELVHVIWCLVIVCLTILAFTLLTRHSLYELRIRDGSREVAAVMSCESNQ
ncbi:Hok/Gef family protein [Erwinia tracheiphila]|nr:type I toxin-antitoxin system Hok family toxin [Erwinia tracheiphila]UIA90170.1 Hok/Gef family protein [Erwinia tracheiphila]UIA98694.1 Hok/Gef family protein [Erwinia tracheiphila]